jgi:hypothetical protein
MHSVERLIDPPPVGRVCHRTSHFDVKSTELPSLHHPW